jgi:hypothetical protein
MTAPLASTASVKAKPIQLVLAKIVPTATSADSSTTTAKGAKAMVAFFVLEVSNT